METRNKIIKAAFRLFADKGTEFSIAEVTKEVGIQKASFYAHFTSKETMLYEIIDREIDNYFFEIKESNRNLKNIFFSILDYYQDSEVKLYFWKRLLLFPPKVFKDTLVKKIADLSLKRFQIIKDIIREYIEEGILPDQNIDKSAIAYLSLIHGLLSSSIIYNYRDRKNEYIEIWQDFWRGIGGKEHDDA
ncbi:MAG: transcriptional regulator [Fusobacteria bacterium]|nr:MAG: transcriptional regulator [Fusobacteriota bacterium]KAF0230153.1 MAG: transcriptional [Fusobacteriota bacterium]